MAFCRTFKFKGRFDDRDIVAIFSQLTTEEFFSVVNDADPKACGRAAIALLPAKIVDFPSPPLADDDTPITIQEVVSYPYFATLAGDMAADLLTRAKIANPSMPAGASGG